MNTNPPEALTSEAPQNAYLFNAEVTHKQILSETGHLGQKGERLEILDSCMTILVCGGNRDEAQKRFEAWVSSGTEQENPIQTVIKRIFAAPMVNQLFTERGPEPILWPQVCARADASLEAASMDEFEQGYWADVNQLVFAHKLSVDTESLRSELPEEIRSGLNWSPGKSFYFLVSVLSPRVAPEVEMATRRAEEGLDDEEFSESHDEPSVFPQLVEKKTAVLVQARNSVIAAWLWRKFTNEKKLPADEIRIDPWCGAISVDS